MDTKTVAVVTTFAALTIVFNLSPLKFPAPYAPYLKYQIWEIPIVAAFLLYGVTVGFSIALINTAILFAVYPGELPTGPLYNLAAVISMLFGMLIAKMLTQRNPSKSRETLFAVSSTTLGILLRAGIMTIVNWTFLRFQPPVGYGMPEGAILIALPLIAIFNTTLALYTIPSGHIVAKAVSLGIKTPK